MHYSKLDHHAYQKYRMPKNLEAKLAPLLKSESKTPSVPSTADTENNLISAIQQYFAVQRERMVWLILATSISIGSIGLGTLAFNYVTPLAFIGKVLSIFAGLAIFTLILVMYQQRKYNYQLAVLAEVRKHDRNLLNDIEFRISNRLYNI